MQRTGPPLPPLNFEKKKQCALQSIIFLVNQYTRKKVTYLQRKNIDCYLRSVIRDLEASRFA